MSTRSMRYLAVAAKHPGAHGGAGRPSRESGARSVGAAKHGPTAARSRQPFAGAISLPCPATNVRTGSPGPAFGLGMAVLLVADCPHPDSEPWPSGARSSRSCTWASASRPRMHQAPSSWAGGSTPFAFSPILVLVLAEVRDPAPATRSTAASTRPPPWRAHAGPGGLVAARLRSRRSTISSATTSPGGTPLVRDYYGGTDPGSFLAQMTAFPGCPGCSRFSSPAACSGRSSQFW